MPVELKPTVTVTIESALRVGGQLSAFSSGGGLRVIRVERPAPGFFPDLIAYGEHPHVDEALRIAADDFTAGPRAYKDVYGPIEAHYLTGESTPNGELDAWIRGGHRLQARFADDNFICELIGMEMYQTPEDTVTRATNGETITWTDERGVTRVASPFQFPNGDGGCSVRVTAKPEGMRSSRDNHWYAQRTGRATDFIAALRAAFAAPKIEIPDP